MEFKTDQEAYDNLDPAEYQVWLQGKDSPDKDRPRRKASEALQEWANQVETVQFLQELKRKKGIEEGRLRSAARTGDPKVAAISGALDAYDEVINMIEVIDAE